MDTGKTPVHITPTGRTKDVAVFDMCADHIAVVRRLRT
jgi:hypothetical protein